MTNPQFSRPGAVDLSGLVAQEAAGAGQPGSGQVSSGQSWVTDLTEASFDTTMQLSLRHPIIVELWSPRSQGSDQLSTDLIELTHAAQGRWLLARVNVDENMRIAQALQVQAVPTVVAILGGQLAPLFEGVQPKAQLQAILDQVVQMAASQGMVGRAEPIQQASPESAEQAPDPRFAGIDEALGRGDYLSALDAYDALLAQTPHDAEVQAGRAQVALLLRSQAAVDTTDPIEAELARADREVAGGHLERGFGRLLTLVREQDGEPREKARLRLLELFTVIGNADPAVLKARRELSTALF